MSSGEAQYQASIERIQEDGSERLGLMTSWAWQDDPKRLAFTFARYKFVAKMFEGLSSVVEIGCGDGFASRIVGQSVENLTAVDFDDSFIADAQGRVRKSDPHAPTFLQHDIMQGPVAGCAFDGAYSLDVMEHIPEERESDYLRHICASLTAEGRCIIGMPSLESQPYASAQSKEGHVNCKTQSDLKAVMKRHFGHVFMFGMNDEMLHTGFGRMAHYNLALCCGPLPIKEP